MEFELEEKLRAYIRNDNKKQERLRLQSLMKLHAVLIDDDDDERVKVEYPNVRPYPKLVNNRNQPAVKLFLYNLPIRASKHELEGILQRFYVNLKNFTIKSRVRDSIAWVECASLEDSFTLQCISRDNFLTYHNRRIKVRIAHDRHLPFEYHCNSRKITEGLRSNLLRIENVRQESNVDHFTNLPIDIIEQIFSLLDVIDQRALVITSMKMVRKIQSITRSIAFTPKLFEDSHHRKIETLTEETFVDLIKPGGYDLPMNTVIITDKSRCSGLPPSRIAQLFNTHYLDALRKVDLVGVQCSPYIILAFNRCPILHSLSIGDTLGPFDRELSSVIPSLKNLRVTENNFFTTRALGLCQKNKLESIEIIRCYKLHSEELKKFILTNETLQVLYMEDCRQVSPSPPINEFYDVMPHTKIVDFTLKYTDKNQLPIDSAVWVPKDWGKAPINLRNLRINGLKNNGIQFVLKNLPYMQHLKQLDISDLSCNNLPIALEKLPHLETLIMHKTSNIDWNMFQSVLPKIKRIVLDKSKDITPRYVEQILDANGLTLKEISLNSPKFNNIHGMIKIYRKFRYRNEMEVKIFVNRNFFKFIKTQLQQYGVGEMDDSHIIFASATDRFCENL